MWLSVDDGMKVWVACKYQSGGIEERITSKNWFIILRVLSSTYRYGVLKAGQVQLPDTC